MGCSIKLKIGTTEKILWSEIDERSGSQAFDDSVAAAVFKLEHVSRASAGTSWRLSRATESRFAFDSRVRLQQEPPL